jgi:tripartite-type tricarboxylate transporter receptor subunit TctC
MRLMRWLALVCLIVFAVDARAQSYPVKPIRYLVTTSPGAGADIVGRTVAAGLTEVLGQQVIVENRAGAAGNIGAEIAAKAPPDGYTIFQVAFAHSVNPSIYRNVAYDLARDFAPITQLGSAPGIIVVHPSLPVKSLAELVKLAKAKPGAINYASAGTGSPTNIGAELLKSVAGIDLMHVPYRGGGEAITSIVSGETSVYVAPLATALPHVGTGRLRPLAVTSATRIAVARDVPTVAELGYAGAESGLWHGLMVPVKTPKQTIATLHSAALAALKRPDVARRLHDMGYTTVGDQPEQFAQFLQAEIEKWRKVVRAIGLKAE